MKELKGRNVTLVPDPHWPDRFESERERIRAASDGGPLGVFHVGSTAIPGVPGKPAVDVIAVYEEAAIDAAMERLIADARYEREGDSGLLVRWAEEYAVFVKLHTRNDRKVRNQLLFRDYLRDHPEARSEYESLKRETAQAHPEDLEAYTKAKSEFVGSVLERAREEGYDRQLPDFA